MPWPYPSWMDVWATLRVNLKALMAAAKAGLRDGPDGVLALEEDCGVGKSTIYRVLDPKQKYDLGLENLHRIAASYGLPAWALLLPKLPAVGVPLAGTPKYIDAEIEKRVARQWERIRKSVDDLRVQDEGEAGSAVVNAVPGRPTARVLQSHKATPAKGKG